ncbi:hypothetical protein [Polyangium aurulentum]|uniref:hypothetical protein n=1 Tax=Polyangium aurulentum TaxID=2567896 RepID=UPI0010AE3CE8|nr:hypothetical protein [Polyangium aurulentum]UQA59956.1 hypothetical protein E8A73_005550 [Polyangium aurulentum]
MTNVIDPRIEQARARFARSLVGSWSTAQGTFGVMMAQHWEIRPDGSGRFVDTGVLGYPKSETRFEWRQDQPFVFELRETELIEYGPGDHADSDENDENDENDDHPWVAISYDFVVIRTDVGEQIGLIDIRKREAKEPIFYFYWSLAPLAYCAAL